MNSIAMLTFSGFIGFGFTYWFILYLTKYKEERLMVEEFLPNLLIGIKYRVLIKTHSIIKWRKAYNNTDYFDFYYDSQDDALSAIQGYRNRFNEVKQIDK